MENAQIQLFDQMLAVFNEEDIRELCFRLNIIYDDLNGQNRRSKTISLVEHCQQTNRTLELVALCQEMRPAVVWPKLDSDESTVEAPVSHDTATPTATKKPINKVPMWIWGVVGLLLVLMVLAIWQPWQGKTEDERTAVIPTSSSASSSPSGNTIGLNQTVSGQITSSGSQTWIYTGSREDVDIRVEGGPDDTFVLILAYADGGQAAYIDYSGRGEGELVKYFNLQENMQIVVDETENDGAEYTLSITPSNWKYLWPGESFGGEILGANPEKFLYDGSAEPVDIIVEMTDAEQPLLEVYKPDGKLLVSANQLNENGRLALTNLELTGEGDQYEIVIRDQANNGAVYRVEMQSSDSEMSEAVMVTPEPRTRPADGMEMVYVPAGSFMMGSDPTEPDVEGDEFPKHTVFLDAFWVDKTEVTNSQFAYFLTQEGNQTENNALWLAENAADAQISNADSIFRADQGFANYPVIEVTWYGASAYCDWVGGSLPTEAQWEYAARGPSRVAYPWGNTFDGSLVNYCDVNCEFDYRDTLQDDQYGRTSPAGSYQDGKSWVGALNMAGNVWEWTADWYGSYPNGNQTNPTGPESTADSWKVIRGGAWNGTPLFLRTANRYPSITQDYHDNSIGFRCVVPAE